jgi:TolB-like protein/cytochrome c-type biogenesis protein CcmH/NrfG
VDFEQGLNNAMKRLRASLDDDAESPHFIETLPRHGYRFIGSVNGTEQTRAAEAKASRSAGALIRRPALGAVAVLTVAAVLLGLNVRGWRDRLFNGSPKAQIQALAVLPLTNLSGDPEQEYFADGMTESLITELGKIDRPRVISRQSVMQYKSSKKSLQEIAGELKVDAVLEGAVERSRDRVRVTIHLSQVVPEQQLWSQEYERSIRDALSLQGEIARAITDEIQVKLTPEERNRRAISRSLDSEVQDNYLRGLYFANNFLEPDSLPKAIDNFKKAIEKDPTFGPAWAELAMAYFWLGNPDQGGPSPKETLPPARAAVTKALQLDPSLARAHLALGLILLTSEWNWSEAENQYRIALKLNPNCADCHAYYGGLLAALGRNDEANAQANQAVALDPIDFGSRNLLAMIASFSRQYDLCIKLAENLGDQWTYSRGVCYAEKKMYPEAIAYLENSVARSGRRRHLGTLALVYGLAGRKSETQKIISELREKSRHHYVFPTAFAYAYLGLGDKDQALTWLERAYEEQDPSLFFLKMLPLLDPLRSEPRFQALMHRVNFSP